MHDTTSQKKVKAGDSLTRHALISGIRGGAGARTRSLPWETLTWQKQGWLQLFQTMPTRSCSVTRFSCCASAENTAPARPYSLP
jgi:hypothetical protein